jgi:superfamily II DNA or RNA helicase
MKTLYPAQQKAVDFHIGRILDLDHGSSLDTSRTGTGKTVVACRVARCLDRVAVICPKICIPQWERELRDQDIEPVFVLNYEKIRNGNTEFLSKKNKEYTWNLHPETLIIWDEVHRCKSDVSLNARMLIASKQQGYRNLMLSATAAKDPTEMRALGYVLGLHSLNKDKGGLKCWIRWMRDHGCRMDPFRNWVPGALKHLVRLNETMYGPNGCAYQITEADLPNAFKENRVITEPLEFSTNASIANAYDGLVSQVLLDMVNGVHEPEPSVLVQILRARQLVEAFKVTDTCALVREALAEGFSTAIFVSFTDTVKMFMQEFPDAAVIVGGQTGEERERNVAAFQSNEKRIIVCNTAAGGAGVSLHDEHGGHPRMTFINPSYNPVDYIQTLGRIHRNGSQSNAVQRVLVAAGTIEEEIISIIERKCLQYNTLHTSLTSDTESES